jgi:tetratricopeptide (TPR) repeat protein
MSLREFFLLKKAQENKIKMSTYTNDILFIQALDCFTYDLEACVQKLQYILGDNNHAGAYYLMGRVYHEHAHDYVKAREYYHQALCIDHEYVETYYDYVSLLNRLGEYSEATHVLEVGLSLPHSDKARLHYIKAIMYERQEQFKKAKESLKTSKHYALNNDYRSFIDDQLTRINEKMKVGKKSKKKKSKKKITTSRKFNSLLD